MRFSRCPKLCSRYFTSTTSYAISLRKLLNMNVETEQRIVQLDVSISGLQAELEELKASKDLNHPQKLRRANLEREIHQLKLLLRSILQGHPGPFHYHRLPPEMLVEIFQWVTNSEDKLALIETFPVVSPLMHWDKESIHFSLVYPHVYPYIYQDLRNAYTLCQVSPHFHQVVLDHHRYLMSGAMYKSHWNPHGCLIHHYEYNFDHAVLTQIVDELDNADYAFFPWMENMPFLFGVNFDRDTTSTILAQGADSPVLQFLERHGHKLWATCISIDLHQHDQNGALDILHEILNTTSNLYFLGVWTWPNMWQVNPLPVNQNGQSNQQMMQVDPRRYPELPNLKFLWTAEAPPCLLQQFAPNLKQFWTIRHATNAVMNCPKLENCQIFQPLNIPACFANILRNAPLKYLRLEANGLMHQIEIPRLLLTLSHFGGTLEKLFLEYRPLMVEEEEYPEDNAWMVRVNLPKLKIVKLQSYFGKLDFLLTMPCLEKLAMVDCRSSEEANGRQPDLLRFPWRGHQKFETNVWNNLTHLRSLYVLTRVDQFSFDRFTVTRSEHEENLKDEEEVSMFTNFLSYLPFLGN